MGILSTAILAVNNLRDADTDKLSGKNTLTVRMGKTFTKIQYSVLVLIPFMGPIYIWWNFENESSLLLTLFALPIAFYLIKEVFTLKGRDLNPVLARTAQLLFIFTVLFSTGMLI